MTQRLFVYGTLAPGKPNEHVLAGLDGSWEEGSVRGQLIPEGWGAAQGYPGIILQDEGAQVRGLLFSSSELENHWGMLDEFEGQGYRRVLVPVALNDESVVDAYIYALAPLL